MTKTDDGNAAGLRPVRRRRTGYTGLAGEDIAAAWTNFIADTSNFHMLHYRHVDGFLVSAKNSGTHWLHYMLSHALATQYGVEPPRHSTGPHADHLIGPAKQKPRYPQIPHLALSHAHPQRRSARIKLLCGGREFSRDWLRQRRDAARQLVDARRS